mgnify:FL=1
MFKKKLKLSPIMTFIILISVTILLSGFLHLINVQGEYTTVNRASSELINNVVEVKNLFSTKGIKHIVTTAVSGFVNFEPLGALIIVLIGIGVLEKTGFMKTFFTILTRNSKRYTITFILVFLSLLFSLLGKVGFVVMLPIGALLFKYGRRNPLGGIIASFASLSFGYGINVFMSANDSELLTMTLNAAYITDPKYKIGVFFALFIMIAVMIITSIVFTHITEKKIMPKLPRVDVEDEEVKITNKELRGLIIGLGAGFLYTLIVIYMIIPGLPLSGLLLDSSSTMYIDMLFGANSMFNKGFIFIVTLLFVIIGLGYGFMTKSIKNNNDIAESLGYSLDGIGNILVLLFFASLFINIYDESGIGMVLVAWTSKIIGGLKFSGIGLILTVFALVAIVNIFCPSSTIKWSMLSGNVVSVLMAESISPEFAQVIFSAADSVTKGLTPLFLYYVIYIAFLEKYNKSDETITLFGSTKYMVPYAIYITVIWAVVIVAWYLTGLPIGIGTLPGVTYGA